MEEAVAAVLVAAVLVVVVLARALRALQAALVLREALDPQAALEVEALEALEVHHHRRTLVVAHQVDQA